MTKQVDLKRRKADPEDKAYFPSGPGATAPAEDTKDYYPITMYLGKPEVDALGVDKTPLGKELTFVGRVRVSSKSQNESDDGWNDRNVTLTVLSGCVEDDAPVSNADMAKQIYDKK